MNKDWTDIMRTHSLTYNVLEKKHNGNTYSIFVLYKDKKEVGRKEFIDNQEEVTLELLSELGYN